MLFDSVSFLGGLYILVRLPIVVEFGANLQRKFVQLRRGQCGILKADFGAHLCPRDPARGVRMVPHCSGL